MSTNPGATILPVASIVSVASPSSEGSPGPRRRTSTIFPSLTPTSARYRSAPVPSTTVPPVILRSNTITPSKLAPADMVVNVTPLQAVETNPEARIVTQTAQVGNPAHTGREDAIGMPPQRPTLVPVERYLSVEFARLETQRMWPKVWQVTCTVDHVAEAGDYFEYRCGPYSVLIVRGDDGTLRAFQNVCRHRGNSLRTGSGADLRELQCGYHGWTWDLSGVLKRVPSRKGFGALRLAELPLITVNVDTWERLVFVNLDAAAMPLADYLEAIPHDIAWNRLGEYRCYATMTVEVDANWKTIADGFSETYHIHTLHPELHMCMDDVHAPAGAWGHTGKSEQLYGVPSPTIKEKLTAAEVWDAYVCTQGALMGVAEDAPFPVDQSAAPVQRLPQHDAADQRRSPDGDDVTSGRRSRPRRTRDDAVDADATRRSTQQAGRRAHEGRRRSSRSGSDPGHHGVAGTAAWHAQPGFTHVALSNEERRVINMHRNLERYLELPGPDRITGGEPVDTPSQQQ
jgi:choline monooxygenase